MTAELQIQIGRGAAKATECYRGIKTGEIQSVHRPDGQLLERYSALRDYGPVPFAWGDRSAGASQLALALLCDTLLSREHTDLADALPFQRRFRDEVIAYIPANARVWAISLRHIWCWWEDAATVRTSSRRPLPPAFEELG